MQLLLERVRLLRLGPQPELQPLNLGVLGQSAVLEAFAHRADLRLVRVAHCLDFGLVLVAQAQQRSFRVLDGGSALVLDLALVRVVDIFLLCAQLLRPAKVERGSQQGLARALQDTASRAHATRRAGAILGSNRGAQAIGERINALAQFVEETVLQGA